MDDNELEHRLKDLESDRVERKASISDSSKIRQTICAFANDLPNHRLPGVLFVGVHDKGECANLTVTDDLLKSLAEARTHILPFPTLVIQKRVINECELVVVIVFPSDAPPVAYEGRVWVRVGPTVRLASAEEERRLAEKRIYRHFDLTPDRFATIQDLNQTLFRDVYLPAAVCADILEQNERSFEQQLSSLRFTTTDTPPIPTIVGLLVIGNTPTTFVPGAYIQFLRIDGTELIDPIKDQEAIHGPLPDMFKYLDEICQAHISVALDIVSQPTEMKQADYPLVALQQIVRNAVLHRTYESNAPVRISWFNDRIEIHNPGGAFGQVTRDNFGQPGITDYRNPHLAEAMKNLGYVQRFGVGITLARRELEKNGNPPLEFVVEDTYVLAIVRRRL